MSHNYQKREGKIIIDGIYAQKNKNKPGNRQKSKRLKRQTVK